MAMLMLVSCRLDNGTGTHRTPAAVENYTSGLMYSVVVNSTEFLDEAIVLDTYLKLSEEERQALMEEIPAGRFGTPEEAAVLACQILEAPEYMTGQIITMDGGWI